MDDKKAGNIYRIQDIEIYQFQCSSCTMNILTELPVFERGQLSLTIFTFRVLFFFKITFLIKLVENDI